MTPILSKKQLSENVFQFRLHAPRIASSRKAGQFIILRPTSDGERIPLTISNAHSGEGWIEIIFQVAGKTTKILTGFSAGESIADLAGPLGKPTHIENFGKCLCIGGGVGAAPLYPIVCALKAAGNCVTTILGARTKDLIILKDEMSLVTDEVIIATDDGSSGIKGFVSNVAQDLINKGNTYNFGVVIGPAIMMKFTSKILLDAKIPTMCSLNPIMIDGTGMCGGCRVTIGNETRFACVDGPEFDASLIEWDEMIERLSGYKDLEKEMHDAHMCTLTGATNE